MVSKRRKHVVIGNRASLRNSMTTIRYEMWHNAMAALSSRQMRELLTACDSLVMPGSFERTDRSFSRNGHAKQRDRVGC